MKVACTVRRRADRKGLAQILPGIFPGKSKAPNSTSLAAYPTVVGDLSQRQMVIKEHQERNKHRNRAVYNDWGLSTFMQMLTYKCHLSGKDLAIISERDTSKMCSACGNLMPMPLWKRTYHCDKRDCGLKMDRDENSARNILKRFLAGRRPHTDGTVRCADVFTATDNVNTCEHILGRQSHDRATQYYPCSAYTLGS